MQVLPLEIFYAYSMSLNFKNIVISNALAKIKAGTQFWIHISSS